jgi:hypothetical protein
MSDKCDGSKQQTGTVSEIDCLQHEWFRPTPPHSLHYIVGIISYMCEGGGGRSRGGMGGGGGAGGTGLNTRQVIYFVFYKRVVARTYSLFQHTCTSVTKIHSRVW